ncbi:MAG TPA: DUF4340 domain-containing protein [Burkholderiales bacterium]
MGRKGLSILVVLLLVLGGGAAWIYSGGSRAWKQTDTKAGSPVLPGLVVSQVATLRINNGKDTATLELKGGGWTVHEREGYPADVSKIGPFLAKLADLKIIQTDTITEALAPRLNLSPPGQANGGTAVDLTGAASKPLGSLLLGKTIDKDSDIPGATKKIPSGRYLVKRDAPTIAIAINDPLNDAVANPRDWLDKTFIKPERVKSLTFTSGGKPRFTLERSEEASMAWTLKDAAKGEELDTGKASDEAGALAGLTMVDVIAGAKPDDLGLTTGDVLTAETFDGLTYTLTIGKKDGDNRAVQLGVSGTPSRPATRTAAKDEKPEDKTRLDKSFKDDLDAFNARVKREQAMDKKVFWVADAGVAALLKDREALMKGKQTAAQPPVPGLDKFESKKAEADEMKKAAAKAAPAKKK